MNCKFLLSLSITLLLLVCIGWYFIDQVTFTQDAPTDFVQGKVIHTVDRSSKTGPSCDEFVQYSPNKKQSQEIDDYMESVCQEKVGDSVTVAYHMDDPSEGRVVPPGGFLLGNVGLIFAMIVILLLGASSTANLWEE